MRRTKKVSRLENLRIAVVFCFLVVTLLAVSLVFKAIALARESLFDGSHRFTIAVSANRQVEVLSFAPDNRTISALSLDKTPVSKIGQFLGIPIDASAVPKSGSISGDTAASIITSMLVNFDKLETKLTILDIARLWYFTSTISSSSIQKTDLSSKNLAEADLDKISSSLFNDFTLSSEKLSIHIINGTNVSGLGGRVARLITNMGGNVVAVSSSDKPIIESMVLYADKPSYTSKHLGRILGFRQEQSTETNGISEIVIVIGNDKTPILSF